MNQVNLKKHPYSKNLGILLTLGKNNLGIDFVPNFVTPKFFVVNAC